MVMAVPLAPGYDDGPSTSYARFSQYGAPEPPRAASPYRAGSPYAPRAGSPYGAPRHASPQRPDSFRGSWATAADDMRAPAAPYDDAGRQSPAAYGPGRQSPAYGGRQSPASRGRQSPAFTPNLPPRLSQPDLMTSSRLSQPDGMTSSRLSQLEGLPSSRISQPDGMTAYAFPTTATHRSPLERNNTEDTFTRFPIAVDGAEPELDEASYPRARSPYVASPIQLAASLPRERTPSMVPNAQTPPHTLNAQTPPHTYNAPTPPFAPRHPSAPSSGSINGPIVDPYGKFAASPSPVRLSAVVAAAPRYVTNPAPPARAANAVYAPAAPEEVCPECSMRDQDMADVDVTSPGIWERESDAAYFDLVQREEEDEAAGFPPPDDPSIPRSQGDPLTERLLKTWLSVVGSIYSCADGPSS
jgi:hypothetical protein